METSQEMDTTIVRKDSGTSTDGAAAAGPTQSPLLNRRTVYQQSQERRHCEYVTCCRQYRQKTSEAPALETNEDNVLRGRDSSAFLAKLLQSYGLDDMDATCGGGRHAPGGEDHTSGEEGHSLENEGHAPGGEGSTSGGEVHAPGEEGSITREEGSIPMEEGSIPMEEGSISMEESSISMEEGSISMEEGSISREVVHTSVEEGHTSGEEGHAFVQEEDAFEIPRIRLDRTEVSLGHSDNTTDSKELIRKEWGTQGTMQKIYHCIKSGTSPVDVHTLVSEGPVVRGQRRLIAARCFTSILKLKQHGLIRINKNSETLEIMTIELGNKIISDE